MYALAVLAAAGLVTWILRVWFIGIVPARDLPARFRRALEVTGPAAMAALIVNDLSHEASAGAGTLAAALVATAVAALVVWRFQNMALVTVAGIGTYAAASLMV